MSAKVTHLIANVSGGEKYQYAVTFRVPIMHLQWVLTSWEYRDDIEFSASMDSFVVSTFIVVLADYIDMHANPFSVHTD